MKAFEATRLYFDRAADQLKLEPSARKLLLTPKREVQVQIPDITGPHEAIPAPDMGTGAREMAWIRNQWEKYNGFHPAVVTGKPVEDYGAEGREEATGRGVGILAFKFLGHVGRKPKDTS